jgi:hypothetical protein
VIEFSPTEQLGQTLEVVGKSIEQMAGGTPVD